MPRGGLCKVPSPPSGKTRQFWAVIPPTAINVMLERFGLELERFRREWVPASEGPRFAQVVTEMVEQVRKPGPSPYRTQ